MQIDVFPLPKGPLAPGTGVQGGWRITSYFGGRIDPLSGRPGNHGGQDIAGAGVDGQPLYAVVDGYVSQGWDPSGGGNWTTLYADNGARFGYGHAKAYAPGVNGKRVTAGTVLAYVGTTGASTGSHLHFAYDSEDANTYYDDPFDILEECSRAGRFVGATPTSPAEIPTNVGELTVAQYEDIMAGLARVEKALGTNLALEGQWENDTRKIVIDGVEYALSDNITEAGWSSRGYMFKIAGKPEVWELVYVDGAPRRRHVNGDPKYAGFTEAQFLSMVKNNPHIVELPVAAEVMLNDLYPVL